MIFFKDLSLTIPKGMSFNVKHDKQYQESTDN